jgi:site-specific DNA-methyltransferase (adenine-specific)
VPKKAPKPLYRRKPPRHPHSGRAVLPRRQAEQQLGPTNDIPHAHLISPAHFELREDGSIGVPSTASARSASPPHAEPVLGAPLSTLNAQPSTLPRLAFSDTARGIWLYHGNSLELLDAIAAKYPDGRFDAIFADPPYFLSNGGITCHAGKMVKVDKGDWDVSRGPELNHEFNTEWLRRCQRVLKPNGTIWVTGTHHVIFSIGYAMQQLGYKILNDIAWEKPNPPPNLSCRYFTHSTETVLWAAKSRESKHTFNYDAMRAVTGKQMKTVWRGLKDEDRGLRIEDGTFGVPPSGGSDDPDRLKPELQTSPPASPGSTPSSILHPPSSPDNVWTITAPTSAEKQHGNLTWLEPGHPASDYSCPACGFWFQLKSQKSRLGESIGAIARLMFLASLSFFPCLIFKCFTPI